MPSNYISSVQSLGHVRLFATPWIAARQASLSITNSWSLHKLTSIESVMPSSHLISVVHFSSCPQSLPASESFPVSQFFTWGGQSIGVSGSTSVLPVNTQDWFPLGWMDWLDLLAVQRTLQSLLQHHSSKASILQCSAFFKTNSHIHTWLLEKPQPWLDDHCWQSNVSAFQYAI